MFLRPSGSSLRLDTGLGRLHDAAEPLIETSLLNVLLELDILFRHVFRDDGSEILGQMETEIVREAACADNFRGRDGGDPRGDLILLWYS